MTPVAALARDGHVVMAADSLTSVYDRPIPGSCRKVRRYRATEDTDALVGVCGTGALATVMDADLNLAEVLRPEPEDLDRWANEVARRVAAICIPANVTDDGKLDGLLLLGNVTTRTEHLPGTHLRVATGSVHLCDHPTPARRASR